MGPLMAAQRSRAKSPQRRAATTRERLLAAAVEAFSKAGYPATGMADVAARADQTTGAVYYHFSSKEGLALAVIDRGFRTMLEELGRLLDESKPSLENLIDTTFRVFRLTQQDTTLALANRLSQTFGCLNEEARGMFRQYISEFIGRVVGVLKATDVRWETDAEQVANLLWMVIHGGTELTGVPTGEVDDVERLAACWRVVLRSVVTVESVDYFEEFVRRTAHRYRHGGAQPVAAGSETPEP